MRPDAGKARDEAALKAGPIRIGPEAEWQGWRRPGTDKLAGGRAYRFARSGINLNGHAQTSGTDSPRATRAATGYQREAGHDVSAAGNRGQLRAVLDCIS